MLSETSGSQERKACATAPRERAGLAAVIAAASRGASLWPQAWALSAGALLQN